MKRIDLEERPDWQEDANACGFEFHTIDGERYWDERHAYCFSLAEIEEAIEDPSAELMDMCYQAVDYILADDELMQRMAIPPEFFDAIRQSWQRKDRDLYGRFDFSFNGEQPAKLLEFNADTPTSLFETAVFQWRWLEDMKKRGTLPPEADQFNLLHEKLVEALGLIGSPNGVMHFACVSNSPEDYGTVSYLADCASQAGLVPVMIDISHIGVDQDHWFSDTYDERINTLFKLYPLEDMVREDFGKYLLDTPTNILEPLWKLVLSNKGLMAVLWQMFPDHPNLLATYFEDDINKDKLGSHYVRKPLLSREGANVAIIDDSNKQSTIEVAGPYGAEGYIRQAIQYLPQFGNDWMVIGSWIVAGQPAGIGIREDQTPITRNTSRFVPHFILD